MNKINSSFIVCGVLSLIGVALSTFTPISLPIAVFVELAPLGWYFSRLLRVARHDTLGQTAIDSIYYFGFLITIFSLAASVFHVWLHGVGNFYLLNPFEGGFLKGSDSFEFSFNLSDTVIVTLLTTTTANVVAFFILVTKYLFPNSSLTGNHPPSEGNTNT